jgi:hypothetical protein
LIISGEISSLIEWLYYVLYHRNITYVFFLSCVCNSISPSFPPPPKVKEAIAVDAIGIWINFHRSLGAQAVGFLDLENILRRKIVFVGGLRISFSHIFGNSGFIFLGIRNSYFCPGEEAHPYSTALSFPVNSMLMPPICKSPICTKRNKLQVQSSKK